MSDLIQSVASHWDATPAAEREDRLYSLALQVAHFATGAMMNEIEAGRALMEARAMFPSNETFGAWRSETLPDLHRNQALRFMQVAEQYGDKPVMLKALSMRALRALSAPSTPQSVRDEVEARTDAGENVTAAEIDRLKREASEAERRAKEAEAKADSATAEADRQRAKADALADGQRDLVEAAKEQARKDAEAKSAAELAKAQSEARQANDALEDQRRKLTEATKKAEDAAMAKAKAEAENLAAAELEKVQADARKAREDEAKAKASVERLSDRAERLRKQVEEHDAFLRARTNGEQEAKAVREHLEDVNRALALAMAELADLEHEPQDDIRRLMAKSAKLCRDFAVALDQFNGPTLIYEAEFAQA
ncbi:hypothetical protein D2T31_12075 [Sinirhodobacter populi]|uniref:DUF3102 domain-containing protein n=1 Tax=Paenirhodobacter populi TaxID=2306993 RepID=A0A443K833_9RHOB|nr:hypothetical protein [Sinirhodobacter populi]RWR28843.1 hypothetical protein D2T31_12075 [Sinirhodobacter populi]